MYLSIDPGSHGLDGLNNRLYRESARNADEFVQPQDRKRERESILNDPTSSKERRERLSLTITQTTIDEYLLIEGFLVYRKLDGENYCWVIM